ncbi:hypothetical protein HUJ04_008198 [Dendroctonus ponderosae]|nr:hypothetical protein HUJ04_008198 [Dendroctonus ponderosae]
MVLIVSSQEMGVDFRVFVTILKQLFRDRIFSPRIEQGQSSSAQGLCVGYPLGPIQIPNDIVTKDHPESEAAFICNALDDSHLHLDFTTERPAVAYLLVGSLKAVAKILYFTDVEITMTRSSDDKRHFRYGISIFTLSKIYSYLRNFTPHWSALKKQRFCVNTLTVFQVPVVRTKESCTLV